jgi:ESCRT-I complex subunit TSG101
LVDIRLFNLVAEDLSIEDTMEILAKALDYERISIDTFLKVYIISFLINAQETRKLAREQFLIKALIQKIIKSAGIEVNAMNGGPMVAGGGMTSAEYYYS